MTKTLASIIADYEWFCVGSLPHKDAKTAVEFVLSHKQVIPFWPELPNAARTEESLPKAERALLPTWRGYTEQEASGLFELKNRLNQIEQRLSVLKVQLMGPLSILRFSEGLEGSFERKAELVSVAIGKQFLWLAEFCKSLTGTLLVQFDEPGFGLYSELTSEEKQIVDEMYSYFYVQAQELGIYLGMHSCAQVGPEFFAQPLDFYSFDPLAAGSSLPIDCNAAMTSAIARGAVVIPGVYPALEAALPARRAVVSDTEKALVHLFGKAHYLKSSACGHAGASETWIQTLYGESANIVH